MDVFGPIRDQGIVTYGEEQSEGYFPDDLGIGGGDDIKFSYCLECGQVQGEWPLDESELEKGILGDLDEEDCA